LPVELNPPMINIILAIVIVIVAVALISLVYFKKHKPNTELDKKL
jgi:flagellar basal body-associated protein FliL